MGASGGKLLRHLKEAVSESKSVKRIYLCDDADAKDLEENFVLPMSEIENVEIDEERLLAQP